MTDFATIYQMCVGKIVNDLRRLGVYGEAEEYVNDGYMNLVEAGKEINFSNLYFYSRKSVGRGEVFLINKKAEFNNSTQKVCAQCGESHPIGLFGITKNAANANGNRSIQPYCRDCAKKYFSQYFNKDRNGWNEKLRSRYRNDAANLSDTYIKKVLRVYGWKTEDITTNVISYKRKQMEAKRSAKNVAA